jgi:hypothetical protein
MERNMFKKVLVVGILFLFIGVAFIPSFNAVSIEEETVSTNTEPTGFVSFAFLYGGIKNRYTDWYDEYFNAVNLHIVSILPFEFYHLNSGEKVHIHNPPFPFATFYGILTDNFIFGLCMGIGWEEL